jgi:hypothetical protein
MCIATGRSYVVNISVVAKIDKTYSYFEVAIECARM